MAHRVLVTGAAGFVGAGLVRRLLQDGDTVTMTVRPGSSTWRVDDLRRDVDLLEIDLRREEDVRRSVDLARPEIVFHLAAHGAYSWQVSPARILETTVIGSANVLEAAAARGAVTVQAGSSSEYGFQDHAPAEDELPQPNSAYAVAKLAATTYGQWVARERSVAVTTLRLYSVYGPWEDPGRLVPTLIEHCMRKELPPLANPGIARDFVYVDDVCEAFVLAAGHARPSQAAVYNVGRGIQTTLAELVEEARQVFGVDREPTWGAYAARTWDTEVWRSCPARAADELGWTARHDLAAGLTRTAAWMGESAHLRRYRRPS